MAMLPTESEAAPPRNVEYTSFEPVAFNFVTNTSKSPFAVVSNAPGVVGKSSELVLPITYALLAESTLMRTPKSTWDPPINVEYTRAEPAGLSLATKAS
jgi:hypothetical protein